ncbi:glycoside hydrolase family 3 C-terminal domain-containing protein [Sphingomonas sp. HF-S3]|uniref:Glycoside hydrolase family 3 C-terminal domain-containing protein n=1 Tax=Sphingomonas rustica TaxID=3103142 RepID=A0ABV0B430_9SPHN
MNMKIATQALASVAILAAAVTPLAAPAQQQVSNDRPWMNARLDADRRVALLLPKMTRDEKLTLVFGYFATDFPMKQHKAPAAARNGSAGYIPGVPRLGIPPQWQADAGIGVASQGGAPRKWERTGLPSGLATAATWNPALAFAAGAMIGEEARASGYNVMLAGSVNLMREPRNGRNFEYAGEDPLLAGTMAGAHTAGVQSNHIISTVKHFAVNDQETDRNAGNSVIDPVAARMSDLLAFQIAIERADPGSVMCAYNRVNGIFSCEHPWLLTQVLRKDWGFKGFVMSDWGGTHSTAPAIAAGLDQQSGYPFDKQPYFGADLNAALDAGEVNEAALDQMVSRILYAMFRHGLFDHPITAAPDDLPEMLLAKSAATAQRDAEEALVLLKNRDAVLPLTPAVKRIVVIGGHADKGVLSGGGASSVHPRGGNAVPGLKPTYWPGPVVYYPSSPVEAMRRQAPDADIRFIDGTDPAAAATAARTADVAIVFATQWAGESFDVSLTLADGQDALIARVAEANPRTVVVLETGGPVFTPWADKVAAVVAAWYPGTSGGPAIANVLYGKVNPSGHLPATFPRSLEQLPKPSAPNKGDTVYGEGATVGYKWYDRQGHEPAFAFGHGLSYTSFGYSGLTARAAQGTISASFTARNTGDRRGKDVIQLYVSGEGWEAPKRLGAFEKLDLAPGQSRRVTLTVDPRLLAMFDGKTSRWKVRGGTYRVMLGTSSRDIVQTVSVKLPARDLPVGWRSK